MRELNFLKVAPDVLQREFNSLSNGEQTKAYNRKRTDEKITEQINTVEYYCFDNIGYCGGYAVFYAAFRDKTGKNNKQPRGC